MKNQKFEIAVAGYDYRFKTYARDGVEASVKVKCFLGKPDAECKMCIRDRGRTVRRSGIPEPDPEPVDRRRPEEVGRRGEYGAEV